MFTFLGSILFVLFSEACNFHLFFLRPQNLSCLRSVVNVKNVGVYLPRQMVFHFWMKSIGEVWSPFLADSVGPHISKSESTESTGNPWISFKSKNQKYMSFRLVIKYVNSTAATILISIVHCPIAEFEAMLKRTWIYEKQHVYGSHIFGLTNFPDFSRFFFISQYFFGVFI